MSEIEQLREALSKISKIAGEVASNGGDNYNQESQNESGGPALCTPKTLPKSLLAAAAKTAIDINPVNAPAIGPTAHTGEWGADLVSDPLRIAVLTAKYWGPPPGARRSTFWKPC